MTNSINVKSGRQIIRLSWVKSSLVKLEVPPIIYSLTSDQKFNRKLDWHAVFLEETAIIHERSGIKSK